MALITLDEVKTLWPAWYILADAIQIPGQTSETLLQTAIALAEAEWAEYMTITADQMTNSLKRHLIHLVRYHLYLFRHGDVVLQGHDKPRIVIDYEETIEALKEGRLGSGLINMTSRKRLMANWFTDESEKN